MELPDVSLETAVRAIVDHFGLDLENSTSAYITIHIYEGRSVMLTGIDDRQQLRRVDGELTSLGEAHHLNLGDGSWTPCRCRAGEDHGPSF